MPEVRMQKTADAAIVENYVRLRNLMLSKQTEAAYEYYRNHNIIESWREHMLYAMLRNNYVVTGIMIDMVYELGNFSDKKFRVEISKVLQNRCNDFAARVSRYVKRGNLDSKSTGYKNIGNVVYARLKIKTGEGVVNLRPHHYEE